MATTFPVDPPFSTTDGVVTCAAPIFTAGTGNVFGVSIYGERPAVAVPSGGPVVVKLPLTAPSGRPAVLADGGYCGTPTLAAKLGESVLRQPIDATAAVADGNAHLLIAIPEDVYQAPGVYDAEGRVCDQTGNMLAYTRAIVLVEPSLFQTIPTSGLPTVDRVRMAIRDFPDANRLIGDYEFSVGEIAGAITRTVNRFNAAPPDLTFLATTHQWPVDSGAALMDGIIAELFELAAAYHRRGHLPYSAGGLSVDDLAKEKDYIKAAQMYRQRWDYWTTMTRQRLNMMDAFGSFGSPYSTPW